MFWMLSLDYYPQNIQSGQDLPLRLPMPSMSVWLQTL